MKNVRAGGTSSALLGIAIGVALVSFPLAAVVLFRVHALGMAISLFGLGVSMGPCLAGYALADRSRKQRWRYLVLLTGGASILAFSLVGAIGLLAALDYLGFGLPPPTPSWGELLTQAQEYSWAWWLTLYPALALFSVMLLSVFVGEGVRSALDPRPVSRME